MNKSLMFCLSLVLLLSSALTLGSEKSWKIIELQGRVSITHSGYAAKWAQLNDTFSAGDILRTSANSRASLIRDKESFIIQANSELILPKLRNSAADTHFFQTLGIVLFSAKKKNRQHFKVETRYGAAIVKGTTFSTQVDERNFRVQVFEGVVNIAKDDRKSAVDVRAGEQVAVSRQATKSILVSKSKNVKNLNKHYAEDVQALAAAYLSQIDIAAQDSAAPINEIIPENPKKAKNKSAEELPESETEASSSDANIEASSSDTAVGEDQLNASGVNTAVVKEQSNVDRSDPVVREVKGKKPADKDKDKDKGKGKGKGKGKKSERDDKSGGKDRGKKSERDDKADHKDRGKKSDRDDKADHKDRGKKSDRDDKADHKDRGKKSERDDKADHKDKGKKSGGGDKSAGKDKGKKSGGGDKSGGKDKGKKSGGGDKSGGKDKGKKSGGGDKSGGKDKGKKSGGGDKSGGNDKGKKSGGGDKSGGKDKGKKSGGGDKSGGNDKGKKSGGGDKSGGKDKGKKSGGGDKSGGKDRGKKSAGKGKGKHTDD